MPRLFCLWLGLLLIRFSRELTQDLSRARKLCGRHLLKEIVKLCGHGNWSQFHFQEETPLAEQISQASGNTDAFFPAQSESSHASLPAWGGGVNPVLPTTVSQEEAIHNLEMQSLPEYQYKKASSPPHEIRAFSSSPDINPDIHKSIKLQKKSTNKIKTISSLFWGNHPQRRRRGYSDKCCLKGCTKEELGIACLPYIDFKNLKVPALGTEIF
ncbi:insulin-like peptide INSL6 isoform X2 [Oryctolagus cuniculus]|uniref:insulin-like peptide INSL6 isoform X2 n=1 Tax=Oryctolagus cuniculus TaxID=9986 RepID=UPI003878FF19